MTNNRSFRVWDIEASAFRYDCFLGCNGELWFNDGGRIGSLEQSKFDIDLFTGLKDKNGVEVFDGDIVRFTRLFGFHSELLNEWKQLHELTSINEIGSLFVGQIVVDMRRGLMIKTLTNDYAEPLFSRHYKIRTWQDWDTAEVIGNIHENPELLCN